MEYNETSDLPFVSKTTPHYHFAANRIGIRFKYSSDTEWPSLNVIDKGEGKLKYPYKESLTAEAFISVHELTPMMFYYLITKDGEQIEQIIKSTIFNIYNIYELFRNNKINSIDDLEKELIGKNLLVGHFPKQMIFTLNNVQRNMEESAGLKIQKLISETQLRIKALDRQLKEKVKIGKKRSGLLKPGIIADWLTSDLMRFQPVEKENNGTPINRSKASSTEYQLLQKTFALFGGEKDRLPAYMKQLNLVDSVNQHPFITSFQWDSQSNILSFYEKYLNERLKYLQALNPNNWQEYQHFLKLKIPKTDRVTLVKGWKNGFNLPRGIFTEAIRAWFDENNKEGVFSEVSKFKRTGFITKTIPLFFKLEYSDSVPQFYNYDVNVSDVSKPKLAIFKTFSERVNYEMTYNKVINLESLEREQQAIHESFKKISELKSNWSEIKRNLAELIKSISLDVEFGNKVKGRIPSLNKLKDEITIASTKRYQNFKDWQKFEKEMRLVKSQDILVWLMCRNLHSDSQIQGLMIENLFLKDLSTNLSTGASLNILNKVLPLTLPVNIYPVDDKGNVLINENPLKTVYIIENQTKVLKLGNFKALTKDRRLNSLFSFIQCSNLDLKSFPISKTRLDFELSKYQSIRVEIFEITLQIESMLINKYPTLPGDNFKDMLNKWNENENKQALKNETEAIISIRNAFSHNQYPFYKVDIFDKLEMFNPQQPNTEVKNGLNIALQLFELSKQFQKTIIQSI